MTEEEWLACTDAVAMLKFIRSNCEFGDRKRRLFASACFQMVVNLLDDQRIRKGIDVLERLADGEATLKVRSRVGQENRAAHWEMKTAGLNEESFAPLVLYRLLQASSGRYADTDALSVTITTYAPDENVSCLVREIFGNPFRSVCFDKGLRLWNGGTAVALAQQMYDSHHFSMAPMLADMLEDAGCTDTQLFDHLRGPGPHVRGCWAVDLVLGKF